MIVAGSPHETVTEVIDVQDSNFKCANFSPFIDEFWMHGSLTVDDFPIFCAGNNHPEDCYVFQESGQWELKENILSIGRAFSAAIQIHNSAWLFTGGGDFLTSSEILKDGSISKPGPNLPVGVVHHCLVKLNGTHIFLIGGQTSDDSYSSKTWTYSWILDRWTPQDDLIKGTSWPCVWII